MREMKQLKLANKTWQWGTRTYIMGILNVTPDSFSDGGRFLDPETALEHAERMIREGADILDVGGESTRPGSAPITEEEEIRRVVPVIRRLAQTFDIPISVDTYRAGTAREAVRAGARLINDIWGLKYDPEMAAVAAACGVPVCLMHNRTKGTEYRDLMGEILSELRESIDLAHRAGIGDDQIIVDPGIGFGKTWQQNLEVMRRLSELKKLGYPVLLGASRKSFIGKVLDLEVGDRLEGTLAVTAAGILKGADILRVHDVLPNVRAARMADSFVR